MISNFQKIKTSLLSGWSLHLHRPGGHVEQLGPVDISPNWAYSRRLHHVSNGKVRARPGAPLLSLICFFRYLLLASPI